MLQKLIHNKQKVRITWLLLSIMVCEMVIPNVSFALSSGPIQPEISSFEPVGTTDMVDKFTGDFVYNIPLMDVEGYPINIAYHGGVTMEQEASWVGLGWNITPGAINRGVRGLPDEFAGDTIEKELNIKPEINKKIGLEVGLELAGVTKPFLNLGLGLGGYVTSSNYRGVGVDLTTSAGINAKFGPISLGTNIGASIGSQTGAAINYGTSVGIGISQSVGNDMSATGSFNVSAGGVYSPRTAHRTNVGFGVSAGMKESGQRQSNASMSTGTSVPISLQNYSAVVTNPNYMNSYSGQLKGGGEIFGVYINAKVSGAYSKIEVEKNGSRKAYGYYNLDKSSENDMLDFSREKDGLFNPTMHLLPLSHLTYDVYAVSGQGTGGSFRPYRNDIGSVFDPVTKSPESKTENGELEFGVGNLFELGGEYTHTATNVESGPWSTYKRPFSKDTTGYSEDLYFKEAGELTENNEDYLNAYGKDDVITPDKIGNVPQVKPNGGKRVTRANYIYTHNGSVSDADALVDTKTLISYDDTTGFKTYPNVAKTTILRVDVAGYKKLSRTPQQVTEIVQVQKDGRRYVYGLPVVNNVQREVTFATEPGSKVDRNNYLVKYAKDTDDSKQNRKGLDNLYSSTVTPTYVAAHLLSAVLSKDYIDVTGNGISDDDLGTYTKFNYTRKSKDYRWRSPIQEDAAQYTPGYISDKKDDKASYLIGSREQWLLHSVETRNYVAEFYVSKRSDARGVKNKILNGGAIYNEAPYNEPGSAAENASYKLDSIALYNKHDRFINGANAKSIKTVLFSYNYDLCKNVPNSTGGSGKLTLTNIQIRYGNSNLNLSAGYSFTYGTAGTNYDYSPANKDRWGFYKFSDTTCNNFEFPYTDQSDVSNDYAKAWSLSEIKLPSGGVIKVDYEADDYAYVQDKPAMEMFKVTGMGNSPNYRDKANQLYFNLNQQNLYFYFKRRKDAENPRLSFHDNYLKEGRIMYYNIPVELADAKFEPIKGYAEIDEVGYCDGNPASDYGYVKLVANGLEGSGIGVNPVVHTALNVGRYNLPQVLFPGSDPESTDMDNVVAGMKNAIKEMWGMMKNPLKNMINQGKAQEAQLAKAYIRLTSPGLKKKGGGQRVKSIKFYDSWDSMAGGLQAIYGKTYDYTKQREDGRGVISSGVASYEPMIGGDELPQRLPIGYQVQRGSIFPPNDPVDLYQEDPIGETFFPAPVVGYSRVTERSINIDAGRSSQSEDIHDFYTARDFPVQTKSSNINIPKLDMNVTMTSINFEQEALQGFNITLNDMHGKPRATEHWVLKPAGGAGAKELVSAQQFVYKTENGQLNNMVPSFSYNAGQGAMTIADRKMGIESDLTVDSRMKYEFAKMSQISLSSNGFLILAIPIVLVLPLPFEYGNKISFKCATVTKVTQQYGILDKVISNNQGAITTVKNEVFDAQTGNALVTSVNNQFNDKEYSVSYPAHWAYKELGPSYENQDANGSFVNPLILDSMGYFARTFVNYNGAFSARYSLPSNIPVARVVVNEAMPQFKLGDELLLKKAGGYMPDGPVKAWVMGYASDTSNCFLILATREPYKESFQPLVNNELNVQYRVARSGNKNQLGETIQSYVTTDSSNIFPSLKNNLTNLISLNASEYKHNLNAVYAQNKTSDSINPFVSGKVGIHRQEQQIVNLKKRSYDAGLSRNAGVFNSAAYWKTEVDNFPGYCIDSFSGEGISKDTVVYVPARYPDTTTNLVDNIRFHFLDGDSTEVIVTRRSGFSGNPVLSFDGAWNTNWSVPLAWESYSGYFSSYVLSMTINNNNTEARAVIHNRFLIFLDHEADGTPYRNYSCILRYDQPLHFSFLNGPHSTGAFTVFYNQWRGNFEISRPGFHFPGQTGPATYYGGAYDYVPGSIVSNNPAFIPGHWDTIRANPNLYVNPYRIRNKILLGKVGHYPNTDNENWVKAQQVTKYNWYGEELENLDPGVGYNSAVYGYNQQLPICVAKNARHGDVLFESFDDYGLLQPKPDKFESYMKLFYSPFSTVFLPAAYTAAYNKLVLGSTISSGGSYYNLARDTHEAHTGNYSLQVASGSGAVLFDLNNTSEGMASGYSFRMSKGHKYVASIWAKSANPPTIKLIADTSAAINSAVYLEKTFTAKSGIIEGWQQYEVVLDIPSNYNYKRFALSLSSNCHYDDLRISPFESNSKGFVYHPVTRKLMATLDENNFATFYEYDDEGNLVRTKKETEKGILTLTESRSTHSKH